MEAAVEFELDLEGDPGTRARAGLAALDGVSAVSVTDDVVTLHLVDQAALVAAIARSHDLGLGLLAVRRVASSGR